MWFYSQSKHELSHEDEPITAAVYSGHGDGLNNPKMQDVHCIGPIPRGEYSIGLPFTHPTCGQLSMRLTPTYATNVFGRSGFLMHGDNSKHNESASEGCIVFEDRAHREMVAASMDHRLTVVE